jgi:hypothetical protein
MDNKLSIEDYFYNLDKNGIELVSYCQDSYPNSGPNYIQNCNNNLNCKFNEKSNACENNSIMNNLELSEMTSEQLENILLARNRMLEINLHKNDIKNKKIYTMFVFLIIIILAMTIIHFKTSK